MSIRLDWVKLNRNLHSLVAAFENALESARNDRKVSGARSQRLRGATLTTRSIADLPIVAEVELAKSRALIYAVRNQLR